MHQERRSASPSVATAEVADSTSLRQARIVVLSLDGAYFAMPDPFSKGTSLLIKIRTSTDFFECDATVTHSTYGLGMGVIFRDISPRFRIVLQEWVSAVDAEGGDGEAGGAV